MNTSPNLPAPNLRPSSKSDTPMPLSYKGCSIFVADLAFVNDPTGADAYAGLDLLRKTRENRSLLD
jgi:hypothetical protein